MKRSPASLAACVLACALQAIMLAAPAQADEILLNDGSKLVGTVEALDEYRVVLETSYAGRLEVRRDAVIGIITDEPRRVVFESGERVLGRLSWDTERGQRFEGELADVARLDLDGISAIEDPASPVAEQVLIEQQAGRAAAVWSSEVSLSIDGASGNTDEFGATPEVSALRETDFDRLTLGLRGRFASQDGSQTENEVIGTVGLERDFSDRWFAFGALRLERDELEDLDLRANLDFGAGYFLIREEGHEFKPRAGLGVQSESFDDGSTSENVVGVAGWDYRYDLGSRWRFTHTLDYRPTLSDPAGAYRLDSAAALVSRLDDDDWGLRLQLRNEFNADPEPGIDELDTVYSVGLQRVFK